MGRRRCPTAKQHAATEESTRYWPMTKITSGDCWRSSEIGKGMLLLLCRALRRMTAERNLRQLQLQLMPVRSSQIQKIHEHAEKWSDMDHIAENTYVGSLHYGLVHKPISVPETEDTRSQSRCGWILEEIFSKFQHGTWKRWDQSLKSSEERWKNSSPRELDGPMSFEERRTCKTPSEIQGTSCARGRQRQRRRRIHLRWQRQRSWHAWRKTWRSFSVARWPMLPDCCDCQQKNVLKYLIKILPRQRPN